MNSIIENREDLEIAKQLARNAIHQQIHKNNEMLSLMVGTLYPSIIRSENEKLREQLKSI